MFDIINEILISEKEVTDAYTERLKKVFSYMQNDLIDSDANLYLKVTGSNNINLGKVNVEPYGLDKMYMYKDLMEDKVFEESKVQ